MIVTCALYVSALFQHWLEHLFNDWHILYPWSVNLFLTCDWIYLNTINTIWWTEKDKEGNSHDLICGTLHNMLGNFWNPVSRHFMEVEMISWTVLFAIPITSAISWTLTLHSSFIKPSTVIQFSSVCGALGLPLCFSGPSFSAIWPSLNLLHHKDHCVDLKLAIIFNHTLNFVCF
jgi:hypothetical protein